MAKVYNPGNRGQVRQFHKHSLAGCITKCRESHKGNREAVREEFAKRPKRPRSGKQLIKGSHEAHVAMAALRARKKSAPVAHSGSVRLAGIKHK
jgi:hypothetical protein